VGSGHGLLLLFSPTTDYQGEGPEGPGGQAVRQGRAAIHARGPADPADLLVPFLISRWAFILLGKDARLFPNFQKTLERKSWLVSGELNLGIVLLRGKRPKTPWLTWTGGACRKPKDCRPQSYLAEALLSADETGPAEAHYQAAAEIDGKSAAAQLGLGRAQARQKRLSEPRNTPDGREPMLASATRCWNSPCSTKQIASRTKLSPYTISFPPTAGYARASGRLLTKAKRYAKPSPIWRSPWLRVVNVGEPAGACHGVSMNKEPQRRWCSWNRRLG